MKGKDGNEFEFITNNGHRLDSVVSALQKSIRRGLEERSLYFMRELIDSGYSKYFWRRMSVISTEDIGLSDTHAAVLINNLAQMNERLNYKKGLVDTFCPTMAVLYLSRATKSREVDYAADWIEIERKEGIKLEPDEIENDFHTSVGKDQLRHMSQITGRSYEEVVNEKFYYEGILSNNPVSVGSDYWKKKVWEKRKLDKRKMTMRFTKEIKS